MSKKQAPPDSGNPFASLDKSRFAKDSGPQKRSPARGDNRLSDLKKIKKTLPLPDNDEDTAYFRQLMELGGVEKADESARITPGRAERSEQSGLSQGHSPVQPAQPDKPSASLATPESCPDNILQVPDPKKEADSFTSSDNSPHLPPDMPAIRARSPEDTLAGQLAGVKVKPAPEPEPEQRNKGHDRAQEDLMLKEFLASASKRPPSLKKPRGPDRAVAPSEKRLLPSAIAESGDEFSSAMREVNPLPGRGREVIPEPPPVNHQVATANLMQDFMDGKIEFSFEFTEEFIEGHVLGLDPAIRTKLKAGSYSYEAHLDLHGLNSAQAFESLAAFIKQGYMTGKRTVLVIPGRGKNSPDGAGILRDKLQEWLTQDPLKRVVLAFATALPKHGGPGAVYVLLRKYKKSRGKIRWDTRPNDPDLF